MDRETLVIRNKQMAEVFHRPALKHRLRGGLLSVIAKAPIRLQNTNARRLLIIRPDHLGDVLLATPAIRALKRKRPDISIHVLCGEWSAGLLAHYDEIDLALTLPFPGFQRQSSARVKNPWLLALRSARMLRQIGYGSAIIMRRDHWWGAMLAFLAGIRERVGYDLPNTALFLTTALVYQHQHAVKQNWRLVEAWAGGFEADQIDLSYPLGADDQAYIERYLLEWGIPPGRPVICIHAGSGAAVKLWTAEKWAKAADRLAMQFSAAVIFTGSSAEAALISDIAVKMRERAYVIAGSTSIGQLAALYKRALLVLGPDSGPMHLAAAAGTPTVALFGPADPVEFAPWGDSGRHAALTSGIGCRPCRILDWRDDPLEYHPCVADISVGQVLRAARRVLQA